MTSLRGVGLERHGKRCTQLRIDRPDLVIKRSALAVGNRFDDQTLVVENDFLGIGLLLDIERRGPENLLGVEIDVEIERDVGDPRFEWLGIAVNVDGIGAVEHRRDHSFAVGGNVGVRRSTHLAGRQEQRRCDGD